MEPRNETAEIQALQSIAKEVRNPSKGDDWKSTYALVMSELALTNIEQIKKDKMTKQEARLGSLERDLVSLERDAAQVRGDIKEYRSNLPGSMVALTSDMTQLKDSKKNAAMEMYNVYLPDFKGCQESEAKISNERQTLAARIDNDIEEKTKAVSDIKKAISEGKQPSEIKSMIDEVEKKLKSLKDQVKELDKSEEKLAQQIASLKLKTESTLISSGLPVMRAQQAAPSLGSSGEG